jgi:hypothetical protein
LVNKIAVALEFIERSFKQFELKIEIDPNRAIEAYQTGVERHIRILPSGARRVEWATKVDAILGDERRIAIGDDGFQFPVLPPALANSGDMRRFCKLDGGVEHL